MTKCQVVTLRVFRAYVPSTSRSSCTFCFPLLHSFALSTTTNDSNHVELLPYHQRIQIPSLGLFGNSLFRNRNNGYVGSVHGYVGLERRQVSETLLVNPCIHVG